MTALPEQTISYKTWLKQTFVDALTQVFKAHPDPLLQRTKVSIAYPRTEVDYPSVVVRLIETDIQNAGVGHQEQLLIQGETTGNEIAVTLDHPGRIVLNWPSVSSLVSYRVYRGTKPNGEKLWTPVTGNSFTDSGSMRFRGLPPQRSTANLDIPEPIGLPSGPPVFGALQAGTYYYVVTAVEPTQAVRFGHSYYHATIEFDIATLSAYDRDLVADTIVQTLSLGRFDEYTLRFLDRVYPDDAIYPEAQFHYININTDRIQSSGESEAAVPWGSEDDLIYQTSYSTNLFGELYSLPPKLTYSIVRAIVLYPQIEGFIEASDLPPDSITGWVPPLPL